MKLCAKYSLLVLVLAAVICSQSLFALDPVIRNEAYKEQIKTYDRVESILNVGIPANSVLTPSDTVSTGTLDVGYLTGNLSYPIELEIQNHGGNAIYYGVYSTNASGAYIPTQDNGAMLMDVNGAPCVSRKHAKMKFFRRPNLSFSGGDTAAATATLIIRTLKGESY